MLRSAPPRTAASCSISAKPTARNGQRASAPIARNPTSLFSPRDFSFLGLKESSCTMRVELTGAVAVCTIHNSGDERTGPPECAVRIEGAASSLSADQVHEGSPISNPELLV